MFSKFMVYYQIILKMSIGISNNFEVDLSMKGLRFYIPLGPHIDRKKLLALREKIHLEQIHFHNNKLCHRRLSHTVIA